LFLFYFTVPIIQFNLKKLNNPNTAIQMKQRENERNAFLISKVWLRFISIILIF